MGDSGSPSVLYVAYRGDEVLGVKTAEEWAAERGCSVRTIRYESTPSAHKRAGTHLLYERVVVDDGD